MTTKGYLDIESIPTQNAATEKNIREGIHPPKNISKKETIDKWWAEKGKTAAEEAYRKTALNGALGEIISIAWAFNDNEVNSVSRRPGTLEFDLLADFYRKISDEILDGCISSATIVIHGGKDLFDLRFLYQRSVILGVRPSFKLCQDVRYNGDKIFDTMTAWAGWGNYCSLDSICTALNIKSPKSKMTGAEVWDYFQEGKIEEIVEYNVEDVIALRKVYKRLTFN